MIWFDLKIFKIFFQFDLKKLSNRTVYNSKFIGKANLSNDMFLGNFFIFNNFCALVLLLRNWSEVNNLTIQGLKGKH